MACWWLAGADSMTFALAYWGISGKTHSQTEWGNWQGVSGGGAVCVRGH